PTVWLANWTTHTPLRLRPVLLTPLPGASSDMSFQVYLAFTAASGPLFSSGRIVCMSTVPVRPWPIRSACGLRCTTTLSNQLDGYWSNATSRLLVVETCWPPLISAVEKSGPRPWMVSTCGRPFRVCTARPGRRPSVSAMEVPGSLPTCSAETASTMESAFFFSAVEFSMLLTKPFTCTPCICFAFSFLSRGDKGFVLVAWSLVLCWLSCCCAAGAGAVAALATAQVPKQAD